jgi:hypothetical protein
MPDADRMKYEFVSNLDYSFSPTLRDQEEEHIESLPRCILHRALSIGAITEERDPII